MEVSPYRKLFHEQVTQKQSFHKQDLTNRRLLQLYEAFTFTVDLVYNNGYTALAH